MQEGVWFAFLFWFSFVVLLFVFGVFGFGVHEGGAWWVFDSIWELSEWLYLLWDLICHIKRGKSILVGAGYVSNTSLHL